MDSQKLMLGIILLNWSKWYDWESIKIHGNSKSGVKIPNKESGVYEARIKKSKVLLTIGKASDLRFRIRQALVKGKGPHSTGDRIRKKENTQNVEVRWAKTFQPAAAEEKLHQLYRKKHGKLPKHVKRT